MGTKAAQPPRSYFMPVRTVHGSGMRSSSAEVAETSADNVAGESGERRAPRDDP